MSTLKTNNVQVGQSATATNNFTLYQPASPDGTVRLGVGNSGATTSDVVTVNNVGTVTATTFSGSGASLTNLNASNLATGTVGTARLASGTASSSTYLRGDQTWAAVSGLYTGPLTPQVFTSSGTFTVPAGITSIRVQVYGAGGGGATSNTGGNGGLGDAIISGLTPGGTVSVTVGTGGNGTAGTATGGTGGTSSFDHKR